MWHQEYVDPAEIWPLQEVTNPNFFYQKMAQSCEACQDVFDLRG
jgi:hypothetical protein